MEVSIHWKTTDIRIVVHSAENSCDEFSLVLSVFEYVIAQLFRNGRIAQDTTGFRQL